MSRFNKASKYKNAFSRVFKKEEWIHDLNVGSNLKSNTACIKASCQYIAFINNSSSVGSLALVPLSSSGRNTAFPTVSGHSGTVTDFDFSPFKDSTLATGGEDGVVKLWQLPEESADLTLDFSATCTASLISAEQSGCVEGIHFNPVADNVLASSIGGAVCIWDVTKQQERYVCKHHSNVVQNFCWNTTGSLLAGISKLDKQKHVIVVDPRTDSIAGEADCHSHHKDSSITWLGDTPYFVSTGYTSSSETEIALWDSTNLSGPVARYSLGNGSGMPMTFYDEDSLMLFVAIKGETSICFFEFADRSLSLAPNIYRGTTQQKGVGIIPKRAVNVMAAEIDRLLVLSQNAIIPVGFHVQRRSYADFHADLYPDTAGPVPALTVEEWLTGAVDKREKVSLDPKLKKKPVEPVKTKAKPVQDDKPKEVEKGRTVVKEEEKKVTEPVEQTDSGSRTASASATKALSIVRSSKVRFNEGYLQHKSTFLEKLPSLSKSIPGDSDGFTANRKRVGVALSGPGNRIAVFELNKPGRVDTSEILTVQNVAEIMDFAFDPFNLTRLAVACDDGYIKIWDMPENGLEESLVTPSFSLAGHYEKPNVIKFHPLARDILASAGYDGKTLIWNVESRTVAITLEPTPEPVFCLSWSPDGTSLASVGKDHTIRVYRPRESVSPVASGPGPVGSRGARLVWLDNSFFVVSGFDKFSQRSLSLYNLSSLTSPLSNLSFDTSPATLIVHYDPDIRLLYFTGKGDRSIKTVEFCPNEEPYLFPTATFSPPSAHQDVKFLPKDTCDVRKVEVGRAVRLCQSTVEPIGFKIPRVKTEYFQDDLFCDTAVTWEPALNGADWLKGNNATQATVSLRPDGMKPLSEAPKPSASSTAPKYSSSVLREKTDHEKKEELIQSMISKMGDKDDEPLPQDDMDGVDSDEWDD